MALGWEGYSHGIYRGVAGGGRRARDRGDVVAGSSVMLDHELGPDPFAVGARQLGISGGCRLGRNVDWSLVK